ncbi:uncharacterized protein LOC111122551 isoform X2 [Crassostrea virginica]
MANSEMALLTEKRLKEMEAEMNRFEREILVPKDLEAGGPRMIIGAGTFNKVKAKIGGNEEPPHKMSRRDGPSQASQQVPKPTHSEGPQYSDPNIPLSVLAAPPPPPPSLVSSPAPSSSSGVSNLAPPPPPPPSMRPNLPFVPHQIRQRMPPPPPPPSGPPGQGPPRPPHHFMGGQSGPDPYSGGYQGPPHHHSQGPPHPHSMQNRGPMMRPPFGGPGPQGPMPPFHGGPPMEQKKDPEKPRIVYSSAPVINKPEKKKKKKKEDDGGQQGGTPDPSKAGPSMGAAPAVMPMPQPEIKVQEHIHEPDPVVETLPKKEKKEKKPKKIIRTAAGETWEDPSLEEWEKDDFRIFCGDLGNEVTDEVLARAFSRYPSFVKSKVVRDKRTNKTKGYGFVSFKDPNDFVQAMREMNGKYVGNRPIKLRKSTWKDRNIEIVRKKEKEKKRLGLR